MKKYRVVKSKRPWDDDRLSAVELQDQFGLHGFTLEHVIETWSAYSERLCAGWLIADKESVEEAFDIKLEAIDEDKEKEW